MARNEPQIGWHTEVSPGVQDDISDISFPPLGYMYEYLGKLLTSQSVIRGKFPNFREDFPEVEGDVPGSRGDIPNTRGNFPDTREDHVDSRGKLVKPDETPVNAYQGPVRQYQVLDKGLSQSEQANTGTSVNLGEGFKVFLAHLSWVNEDITNLSNRIQLVSQFEKMVQQGLLAPFTMSDIVQQGLSDTTVPLPLLCQTVKDGVEYSLYIGFTWESEKQRYLNISISTKKHSK
ncbi:MAG: hypothetical protein MRZ79_06695 [Bacteroidia bacterium]|nr:hypothetical protein [Bacteroidia bacterium]